MVPERASATAAPGKPIEISVDINRLGGFKEPIELVAEGPREAKQEQIESKDAKKAPLRLSGLKAPQNVPFRLYARIKGREETRKPVTGAARRFRDPDALSLAYRDRKVNRQVPAFLTHPVFSTYPSSTFSAISFSTCRAAAASSANVFVLL